MTTWHVYLILCSDGSIYTGVSENIKRRFLEHKSGKGSVHTKKHKPVVILYSEKFSSIEDALKRERQIKGWRRQKKLNLVKFGKPII